MTGTMREMKGEKVKVKLTCFLPADLENHVHNQTVGPTRQTNTVTTVTDHFING